MSHEHSWPDEPVACVEVGPACCLFPVRDEDPGPSGFWFAHDVPGSEDGRCVGRVRTDAGGWVQTGTLEGGDLTLGPSILCVNHQFHGFVVDGRWRPA